MHVPLTKAALSCCPILVWLLARKELRCLKRKDLMETMAKNIPAGSIRFGCHVVAIQQDPGTNGAILTTVDGGTIRAKVSVSLIELKSAVSQR